MSNTPEPEVLDGEFGIDADSGCDSLHFMVLSTCNEVMMQMCQPVSFFKLTPEQALELGQAFIEAANVTLSLQKDAANKVH